MNIFRFILIKILKSFFIAFSLSALLGAGAVAHNNGIKITPGAKKLDAYYLKHKHQVDGCSDSDEPCSMCAYYTKLVKSKEGTEADLNSTLFIDTGTGYLTAPVNGYLTALKLIKTDYTNHVYQNDKYRITIRKLADNDRNSLELILATITRGKHQVKLKLYRLCGG